MKRIIAIAMSMAVAGVCGAQEIPDEKGFRAGFVRVKPTVEALAGYDNRVLNVSNQDAEGDFYSELAVAAYIANSDARYDLLLRGLYGYRSYTTYSALSDDFYDVGGSIKSDQNPLKLGFSTFLKKTLDYDTSVNPSIGEEPGSVITDRTSTRLSTLANVSYEKQISERTSIEPGYDFWYYFQNFEEGFSDDAEWQVHRASLKLGYASTPKTKVTATGYYSVQVNDDEAGNIGSFRVGIESRSTEKTKWIAQVGVSAADYELSGSDQGFVSYLRGMWDITDKVSAYFFGGNDFQPGYSGGAARMVYRAGYGAGWRVVERWRLSAQLLHDYQDVLGGGSTRPGVGEVRHFATAKVEYDITRSFSLALRGRYAVDEKPTDKAVVSLFAMYEF